MIYYFLLDTVCYAIHRVGNVHKHGTFVQILYTQKNIILLEGISFQQYNKRPWSFAIPVNKRWKFEVLKKFSVENRDVFKYNDDSHGCLHQK